MNTFGALYETVFESVYSRTGKSISNPLDVQRCVNAFNLAFPKIDPFTTISLFEEGEHELTILDV